MKEENNEEFDYHKYFKELSKFADNLDVYKATSTTRRGLYKIRDIFIIGRQYYAEGNYYIGMVKDIIYLLALFPLALSTVGLDSYFTIPFIFIYLMICISLGYASYRWIMLARAEKEYDDKMSVSRYMTWSLLKQILNNQKRLEEKLIKKRKRRKK